MVRKVKWGLDACVVLALAVSLVPLWAFGAGTTGNGGCDSAFCPFHRAGGHGTTNSHMALPPAGHRCGGMCPRHTESVEESANLLVPSLLRPTCSHDHGTGKLTWPAQRPWLSVTARVLSAPRGPVGPATKALTALPPAPAVAIPSPPPRRQA